MKKYTQIIRRIIKINHQNNQRSQPKHLNYRIILIKTHLNNIIIQVLHKKHSKILIINRVAMVMINKKIVYFKKLKKQVTKRLIIINQKNKIFQNSFKRRRYKI